MPETVSTTTAFNLPIDEIIEEAYEHLGGEHTSGQDARSARRSLNLLFQDMMTRGYPLLQTELRSMSTTAGNASYSLGSDVLAIIDANALNSDGIETSLANVSIFDYFSMPDKAVPAEIPTQYSFDRSTATPKIFLYPTPSVDGTINYWCVKKPKDVTASYQLADITARYLPALTIGLAFFLSLKKPQIPLDRVTFLKQEYIQRLDTAYEEDREKSDIQFFPYQGSF